MTTFRKGQMVTIHPDDFDHSPAWVGEIVSYWRNDSWIVRELDHGTTCAYHVQRLTRASKKLPAPQPFLVTDDEMDKLYE